MQKIVRMSGIIAFFAVIGVVFTACPTDEPPEMATGTGTITGRALFTNNTDNSGITITLEKTDGLRSISALEANRNIAAGARSVSESRSIARTTSTATDGSFTLSNIPAGTYTLYASSQNSMEKAVTTNITVTANQTINAETLNLTAVGSITGRVLLDNNTNTGNFGFLVCVAGTSYMAMTGNDGRFTISNVPAGTGYLIVIMKGHFTAVWTAETISVNSGQTTTLEPNPRNFTTTEIGGIGIVWQGERSTAPTNPQINWAYYNTANKTSYIWNGTKWDVLAAQGEKGDPGTSGSIVTIGENGNWFIDGVDTNIKIQGSDGKPGSVVTIVGGTWHIDGENTGVSVYGVKGEDGKDGSVVTIVGGFWYIDGATTGIPVQGEKGDPGVSGVDGKAGSVITIKDGRWHIDGADTGISVYGLKGDTGVAGKDGSVVTIVGGFWYIDGVTTGIPVQGEKGDPGIPGVDGKPGSVVTIVGGTWHIDGVDTGVSVYGLKGDTGSAGKDGTVVTIVGGYWYLDGVSTGIPVQGPKGDTGNDGLTPFIGTNGNWWIGTTDTGIKAQGPQGANGENGNDGLTPYIGTNGNWWIGMIDTGVRSDCPLFIIFDSTSLANTLQRLQTYAASNNDYFFLFLSDAIISPQTLSYSGKDNIRIWFIGLGSERTISLSGYDSLFTVGSGVTLILDSNVTLLGHDENTASLVTVGSGGELVMNEGAKIMGNTHSAIIQQQGNLYNGDSYGGGVCVNNNGSFTMAGGEISGNKVFSSSGWPYGGGVHVNNNGTFLMSGGKITGNMSYGYSYTGSGVTGSGGGVSTHGTFTMTGGEISSNINQIAADSGGRHGIGGGGVYVRYGGGKFIMRGGKITDNTCYLGNGGVSVDGSDGTFTMYNGSISNNTGTGVSTGYMSTFTMNGGTVSGNTGRGGIHVSNYSIFTMNNGTISNNAPNVDPGGGVHVGPNGTFIMNDGIISNNTKSGGVRMSGGQYDDGRLAGGIFTMNGGTISGNTWWLRGAGVYVEIGIFTKTGGTIYGYIAEDPNSNVVRDFGGNVLDNLGHAVYINTEPVKRRETTADSDVNLDSAIDGIAGGWEN